MKFIECPHCKRQYTIQEIFLPDYLLGKATHITRDNNGQIFLVDGIEQDLLEEYTCDECNTTFKVKADIKFEVEKVENKSFDDEYETTIFENRLILGE